MIRLPRQIALVLASFPAGNWAAELVNAVNQFSLEVVQAFRFAVPQYKTLTFTTGTTVADSFPIDFPVESTPVDVWVANSGESDVYAVTVKWAPIVANGNQLAVRVNLLTGLASASTYSIRLGYR